MPKVACPRCGTAQLASSTGYTCSKCGAMWAFATCEHCGARFHMLPGTTAWTCPECGHEHGGVTMGQLEPDEAPAAPEATTAGAAAPTGSGRGGPPTRGRLAAYAVGGIAAVLAIAFALSAFGGSEGVVASGTPSSSAAPSPSGDPVAALCLHLRDLQTPREASLTRLADTLQADAAAIEAQGNEDLATNVLKLRTAALAYRDALVSQGDLAQASAEMGKAVQKLPCGT